MFENYLKIAMRNIKRHKGYSFINIVGLAIGMACCIMILFWVQDELGYNKFHEKAGSLYLVRTHQHYGTETVQANGSVPALGPALKAEYPEILNAARFQNGQGEALMQYGEKKFKEQIQLADPEIFELFTFPFVKGNPKDVYSDPYVMVLSDRMASKYFGSENPIGKSITLDNQYDFRIVGVMKDIPHNSTIRFDVWVPLELTRKLYRENYIDTWFNLAFRTYVQMADNVSIEEFNKKIFNRIRQSDPNTNSEPFLYPFNEIYLDLYGRMQQIRIFSLIALFILIIACINFMNLTTARSASRAKEVGLRKVVGAHRKQVMGQFFGESTLVTFLSLLLAFVLIWLFMPAFRLLTGKPIHISYFANAVLLVGIFGVALLTGLLSGSYPALYLSAFRPVSVLKGMTRRGIKGRFFRTGLVVIQFALSVLLIIGTTVIYSQVHYLKNKSLGFDKEHLLYIPVEGELSKNHESMKHELLKNPGLQSVSLTSHSPTGIYWNGQDWDWEGRDPNVNPLVTYFCVDPDFLKVFKMEMAQGESFRPGTSNSGFNVVINERFAEIMGLENVVGTRLSQEDVNMRIIGVVRDFHFKPVYRRIEPIMIVNNPDYIPFRYMFMRLKPGNIPETIAFLEKTYKKFNPAFPFEYHFLDEDYDRLYRSVEREMGIVRTFGILAIFISCLGLFGLAAFTAEQRTKEIGVRKVLGASIPRIILLLSREYAKWVLIANIIAWPVSYFVMRSWLQDFDYRISLSWHIFALSAVLSLLIAQLTVSFQAFKAARTNPVDCLRYE